VVLYSLKTGSLFLLLAIHKVYYNHSSLNMIKKKEAAPFETASLNCWF